MSSFKPKTIDAVIAQLDLIIAETKAAQNPLGYFAALYRKVTIKVKEGIAMGIFQDGPRMEQLDVIFANRYLDAYSNYKNGIPVTDSWIKAFEVKDQYWPIVLQHLMIGMNAHINLDLGIAAAEVSKGKNLADLETDFNQINIVLSKLVDEVENELSAIWPTLKRILKYTQKIDDFLVDFSMKKARKGAWKFANEVFNATPENKAQIISKRDQKVARNTHFVFSKNLIVRFLLGIVRIGEKGTVKDKIEQLGG